MRVLAAAALVLALGCSKKSVPALPVEPLAFKDPTHLDYKATGAEDPIRITLKKGGKGWILECKEEGAINLDANGVSAAGQLLPAQALESGKEGGPPLWLPSARRSPGATAWYLVLTQTDPYGGEEKVQTPVTVKEARPWDNKDAWYCEYQSVGLAQAFTFTIRAYYEKATGFLLRYEYSPFTGGGSGWSLVGTN
jgi:hypothetical protein